MGEPPQLSFFDLPGQPPPPLLEDPVWAAGARDAGMSHALRAQRVAAWKNAANDWLARQPIGVLFTTDDLVRAVGVPDIGANRNNVVGAWTSGNARAGRIVFTGRLAKSRRVVRHAGMQRLWRKA